MSRVSPLAHANLSCQSAMKKKDQKGHDIIILHKSTWVISSDLIKHFHKDVAEISTVLDFDVITSGVFRDDNGDYFTNPSSELINKNTFHSN